MSLEKLENNLKKLENWKKEGYRWVCIGCNTVYREKPQWLYEDGHGGRYIDICKCGCDLFFGIDRPIVMIKGEIIKLKNKVN